MRGVSTLVDRLESLLRAAGPPTAATGKEPCLWLQVSTPAGEQWSSSETWSKVEVNLWSHITDKNPSANILEEIQRSHLWTIKTSVPHLVLSWCSFILVSMLYLCQICQTLFLHNFWILYLCQKKLKCCKSCYLCYKGVVCIFSHQLIQWTAFR